MTYVYTCPERDFSIESREFGLLTSCPNHQLYLRRDYHAEAANINRTNLKED